jgi:hypothetical protein
LNDLNDGTGQRDWAPAFLAVHLYQAYVALKFSPPSECGSRLVSVAHFGEFEVRLVELAQPRASDAVEFWIELYRHNMRMSSDSHLCHDLHVAQFCHEVPRILRATTQYVPQSSSTAIDLNTRIALPVQRAN